MIRTLTAAISAAFLALPAAADTLTVDFFGSVDRANDGGNNALTFPVGSVSQYDPLSGFFTVDTDTGSVSAFSLSIDTTGEGLLTWTAGSASLSVQNNQTNGSATNPADAFQVIGFPLTGPSITGYAPTPTGFAAGWGSDTDTSILTDTSVPDEGQFIALLTNNTIPGWNWLTFDDGSEIRYVVTDLSFDRIGDTPAVPLPASAVLLIGGLGALAGLRRRTVA